jgi:hypothetical protein
MWHAAKNVVLHFQGTSGKNTLMEELLGVVWNCSVGECCYSGSEVETVCFSKFNPPVIRFVVGRVGSPFED